MNSEITNYFYKTYPSLFKEHSLPMTETAMCWGLQCGDGWREIIDSICTALTVLEKKYKIDITFTTIKEKFGSLRIYYSIKYKEKNKNKQEIAEHISNLILFYEMLSECVCEMCGKEGRLRRDRLYIQTLCDECNDAILKESENEYRRNK